MISYDGTTMPVCVEELLERNDQITVLYLNNSVSNETIISCASHWVNLTSLTIDSETNCQAALDIYLMCAIAQHCHKLIELGILYVQHVDQVGLISLIHGNSNLQTLKLCGIQTFYDKSSEAPQSTYVHGHFKHHSKGLHAHFCSLC